MTTEQLIAENKHAADSILTEEDMNNDKHYGELMGGAYTGQDDDTYQRNQLVWVVELRDTSHGVYYLSLCHKTILTQKFDMAVRFADQASANAVIAVLHVDDEFRAVEHMVSYMAKESRKDRRKMTENEPESPKRDMDSEAFEAIYFASDWGALGHREQHEKTWQDALTTERARLLPVLEMARHHLRTIQLYTVPNPDKPVLPHIANDLMMIERIAVEAEIAINEVLGEK